MAGVPSKLHPGKRPSCSHKGACPVKDVCPVCNREIGAHDEVWREEWVASTEGLVATANYCSTDCEVLAQEWATDVAGVLRKRKGVGSSG